MSIPSSRVGVQTRLLTRFESPLNQFSSRSRCSWGNHGRVLLGPEHLVGLVEELEVVVVGVLAGSI